MKQRRHPSIPLLREAGSRLAAGSEKDGREKYVSSDRRYRPHPTVTRCSSRADRSPPASAPLCARFGPAPPAHGGVIHGHARRSGCVCSAARASRLRLRVAPGSVQPAVPSALRGGRTRRLHRLSLTALRIHSLRSGHGLPKGLPAQAGWSLAAARAPLRRMGCCIVALACGWRWGVGSARHRFCGRIRAAARCRRHRAPARPPRARVYPDPTPVANHSRVTPRRFPPGRRHPRQ